jgi:hypothetical protein
MVIGEDGWPSRSSVETAWRQVISGDRTRENVHAWSAPWVEGSVGVGRPHDVMVGTGLQYLHGLDMTADPGSPSVIGHGGPGSYVLSDHEVRAHFEHWIGMCREFDDDPQAFVQRRHDQARRVR